MDQFSTERLGGVVESLVRPNPFILSRYFGGMTTFETEVIDFDVVDKKRRVAPFVHPAAEGKLTNKVNRKANTFAPAYTKDKRVFDSSIALKRAIGEQIGGNTVSMQDRMDAAIAIELQDQVDVLTRRFELMAVESLRTGKVVVTGDKYPTTTVDFQRDATLTIAQLGGAAAWTVANAATAKPLDNLRTWALQSLKLSGVYPTDIFMTPTDYGIFINTAQVSARWTALNSNVLGTALALGTKLLEGGMYMGSIDGFNIFVYTGWYTGEDDAAPDSANQILPDSRIFGVAQEVQGVRAFGAIRDVDALIATEYYAKSWSEPDPSQRFFMMQSAPLMIPTRANATFGAQIY